MYISLYIDDIFYMYTYIYLDSYTHIYIYVHDIFWVSFCINWNWKLLVPFPTNCLCGVYAINSTIKHHKTTGVWINQKSQFLPNLTLEKETPPRWTWNHFLGVTAQVFPMTPFPIWFWRTCDLWWTTVSCGSFSIWWIDQEMAAFQRWSLFKVSIPWWDIWYQIWFSIHYQYCLNRLYATFWRPWFFYCFSLPFSLSLWMPWRHRLQIWIIWEVFRQESRALLQLACASKAPAEWIPQALRRLQPI